MAEWGIEGWDPEWFVRGDELLHERAALLRSCMGSRVIDSWLAYDDDGEWWADAPVLLHLEAGSLAFCASHACRFAVEEGMVDVHRAFRWCGDGESLKWRASALRPLAQIVDRRLTGAGVFEYRLPAPLDRSVSDGWGLSGIELRFDGDRSLAIWNALGRERAGRVLAAGPDSRWVGGVGPGPWEEQA